jgi:hypothetical protein
MILRAREDAQHVVPRYEPPAAERERRQSVRGNMRQHASVVVRDESHT